MNELFDLTGKVALVTGGSRGLGLQMVRAFARAGANVVIASRKLDACEEVAKEVRGLGREALAVAVHAGKWTEVEALANKVYEKFGRLDILVNNAGMSPAIASHEVTEDLFDKVMGINFKAPFRLASLVAKRMFDGDGGSIINISATAAFIPTPGTVPYAGAKAALNAMSLSLAREYGPKVRVNSIAAGPFLTDLSKHWPEQDRKTANNCLRRPGRPEEIMATALYLASSASSFVTGTVIRCDGGLDAQPVEFWERKAV